MVKLQLGESTNPVINSLWCGRFFYKTFFLLLIIMWLQVREILDRERIEISDQIMAEIDTTELVYLEQALQLLKQKEDKINAQYDKIKIEIEEKTDSAPTVYEKQLVNENKQDWFDVVDDVDDVANVQKMSETIQDFQVEDLAISLEQSNLNPDAPSFSKSDLNDNQPEEFPLVEEFSSVDNEQYEEQNNDDNSITDIDKQNQAKYFYFYQGNSHNDVFVTL